MSTSRIAALAAATATLSASATLGAVVVPAAHADPAGKLEIVLDASGSMADPAADGKPKIQAARQALTTMVNGMPDGSQVGMRVYGATQPPGRDTPAACSDSQQVVPVGALDKAKLNAAIGRYSPKGQTPTSYALKEAAKDLGSTGQRSIVLVSDGEATCSPDPCVTAKELARQGVDLRVDVVGFKVSEKARSQLQCISSATNGKYYDAADTSGLTSALQSAKNRALQPFSIGGTPVTGTPTSSGAPVIGPGRWTDKAPATGKTAKFYALKHTMPGSTFLVGVTSRPSAKDSQLRLQLKTPDGTSCGSTSPTASNNLFGRTLLTGALSSASPTSTSSKACASQDLNLSVSQTDWGDDAAGTPVEFDVVEVPAATNEGVLPREAEDATWQTMPAAGTPTPAAGGSGLPDATAVQAGSTSSFDLLPGETKFFKVPATWGQQVQAQATAEQNPAYGAGSYRNLSVSILSPAGGYVQSTLPKGMPDTGSGTLSNSSLVDDSGAMVGSATTPIRYTNGGSVYDRTEATSAPGDYYVAVALTTQSSEKPDTLRSPLKMTLQVATPGKAGEGAPAFAAGQRVKTPTGTVANVATGGTGGTGGTGSTATPSDSGAGSAAGSASATAGTSGDAGTEAGGAPREVSAGASETNWTLIGGLGGGAALLAALGTVAAVAMRRR
ncbi:VWA domain-containing protein [Flexivirga sp. ID2601S]|uniref:VWA domain-containing protein n=1 Tax=Flexivirga aerilata TaxID=1656889 RepID=A0A849AHK1_9MICO|nr:VWA domain-containing protein [Flexivirga aerilata]NNG38668.1 VWA domain-containing protein [Flexivirga aerilata]